MVYLEQYLTTGWTKLEYRYSKYLVLFGPYLSVGLNWTKFSPWTKLEQMWENSDHLDPWTIFYLELIYPPSHIIL